MIGDDGINGVLSVTRPAGGGPFDDVDRDLVVAIAAQAELVMQLTEIRRDNEDLRLIGDRTPTAIDLRHWIIQRLFGLGLTLQAVASRTGDPQTRTAIANQIDEVDAMIRAARDAVFTVGPR